MLAAVLSSGWSFVVMILSNVMTVDGLQSWGREPSLFLQLLSSLVCSSQNSVELLFVVLLISAAVKYL